MILNPENAEWMLNHFLRNRRACLSRGTCSGLQPEIGPARGKHPEPNEAAQEFWVNFAEIWGIEKIAFRTLYTPAPNLLVVVKDTVVTFSPIRFPTHTFRNTRTVFVTTRVFTGLRFTGAMPFRDDLRKIFYAFDVPIGLWHRYSGRSHS
jgi:hypothetical protein